MDKRQRSDARLSAELAVILHLVVAVTLPWEGSPAVVLWTSIARALSVCAAILVVLVGAHWQRSAVVLAWIVLGAGVTTVAVGLVRDGIGSHLWLVWLACGLAVTRAVAVVRGSADATR